MCRPLDFCAGRFCLSNISSVESVHALIHWSSRELSAIASSVALEMLMCGRCVRLLGLTSPEYETPQRGRSSIGGHLLASRPGQRCPMRSVLSVSPAAGNSQPRTLMMPLMIPIPVFEPWNLSVAGLTVAVVDALIRCGERTAGLISDARGFNDVGVPEPVWTWLTLP